MPMATHGRCCGSRDRCVCHTVEVTVYVLQRSLSDAYDVFQGMLATLWDGRFLDEAVEAMRERFDEKPVDWLVRQIKHDKGWNTPNLGATSHKGAGVILFVLWRVAHWHCHHVGSSVQHAFLVCLTARFCQSPWKAIYFQERQASPGRGVHLSVRQFGWDGWIQLREYSPLPVFGYHIRALSMWHAKIK